jgi:hypothetical protein
MWVLTKRSRWTRYSTWLRGSRVSCGEWKCVSMHFGTKSERVELRRNVQLSYWIPFLSLSILTTEWLSVSPINKARIAEYVEIGLDLRSMVDNGPRSSVSIRRLLGATGLFAWVKVRWRVEGWRLPGDWLAPSLGQSKSHRAAISADKKPPSSSAPI